MCDCEVRLKRLEIWADKVADAILDVREECYNDDDDGNYYRVPFYPPRLSEYKKGN